MREKECHAMKEWKEELGIGTTEESIYIYIKKNQHTRYV